MCSFESRSLCRLVYDEYCYNSLPISQHICAMCGRLLAPNEGDTTQFEDAGKPGLAMQCRGIQCNHAALPPFLLLFSKALLARRLPTLFKLADGRLQRKGDRCQFPWLVYDTGPPRPSCCGGRVKQDINEGHPWWYCMTCWNYNHMKSVSSYYSDQRVPMRTLPQSGRSNVPFHFHPCSIAPSNQIALVCFPW